MIKKKFELALADKKKIFDKFKYNNFVQSSRLEGITIIPVNYSFDEIIKKYQIIGARMDDK